jgi:SGNH domain (fused to AT3 domains)
VTVYKASCPVPSAPVFRQLPTGKADHNAFAQCATRRKNAFRYIRSLEPAGLIMAFNQVKTTPTGLGPVAVWRSGMQTSLQALAGLNVPIVEIGINPSLPQTPDLCLTRHDADPSTCTGRMLSPPRSAAERAVVEAASGTYIDVAPWFCIDGKCPVIIDNRIAYAKGGHVSAQYAADLEPLLAAELRSAGLH